jgi:hypothetical protein
VEREIFFKAPLEMPRIFSFRLQCGRPNAAITLSAVLKCYKDAAQQMRGIWIIEIAELDAISRAEVSRIKAAS